MNASAAEEDEWNETYSQSVNHFITFLQCIMIPLSLMGNFATITAFCKVRTICDKPSDIFILSLACADFGVGFLLILSVPIHAIGFWPWGKLMCKVYVCFGSTFVISVLLTTLVISVDRFILIAFEYPKYVAFQSRKRVVFTIASLWIYAFAMTTTEWIVWDIVELPETMTPFDYGRECHSPPKHTLYYSTVGFTIGFFIPLISVEVLSAIFVYQLRRKLKRHAQVRNSNQPRRDIIRDAWQNIPRPLPPLAIPARNNNHPEDKLYVKAAISLAALVLTLNICFLPFISYSLYVSLMCQACNNGRIRDTLSIVFVNFHACINPLLYAVTMRKIRHFYRMVLCRNMRMVCMQYCPCR